MLAASHRKRLRRTAGDDQVALLSVERLVGDATQPAKRLSAIRYARVPEAHRGEMRQARMVVAAAMNHSERAVLVEPFEANHGGVESEAIGNLDNLAFGNPQLRPRAVVRGVTKRDHRVQAVVATRQLDDHKDPVGVLLNARAFERLRGERRGRAVQDEGQTGTDAKSVHPPSDEVAAIT